MDQLRIKAMKTRFKIYLFLTVIDSIMTVILLLLFYYIIYGLSCLFAERDSGKLKYDHDHRPESGDGYTPASLVSTATTSHFPVPTLSSTITVIAPTHHHSNNTTESWSDFRPDHPVDRGPFSRGPPPQQRKRCRDYDGKES